MHQGHHSGARAPARGWGSKSGSREGGASEVGFRDGAPEEEEEVALKVLGGGVPSGSRGGGAPKLGFRGRGADKEEEDRGRGHHEGARRR